MSQRLTESTGVMQFRALMKPRILGWVGGCPVWSIAGGEGEGTEGGTNDSQGGSTGDGGAGSGDGGTGSEGQGNTGTEGDGKEGKEGGSSSETVSRTEYEQLRSRMQAADRNRSAVEAKLKEYEDRDKSELDKANETVSTLTETGKAKDTIIKRQAVQLAFMSVASNITWHNPADALEFAMKDLSDLEVAEDGTVDSKAVKAAADKLAKDKPYLVKANTSQSGSGGNGASGTASVGRSSGSSDKEGLERDKLVGKYPALRR